MEPKKLNEFIERIYEAGPEDREGRERLLEFIERPDSMDIVITSIESGQLSRNSVLICLSAIPYARKPQTTPHKRMCEWFMSFVETNCESLVDDDEMLAFLPMVYSYIYEENQGKGALWLRNKLSIDGPQQCYLAMKIVQNMVEDGMNVSFLVSIAIVPLKFRSSSDIPEKLVKQSLELILLILNNKFQQHENRLAILNDMSEALGDEWISEVVALIKDHEDEVPALVFDFFRCVVKFPLSAFKNVPKNEVVMSIMCEIIVLIQKGEIPFSSYQQLASLCIALKQEVEMPDQSEDRKAFIKDIGNFLTQMEKLTIEMILDPANMAVSVYPAECILDFWSEDQWCMGTETMQFAKQQQEEICGNILSTLERIFFSEETFGFVDVLRNVLSDPSTVLIDKIADVTKFKCASYAEMVSESLKNFAGEKAVIPAAFCIEYFSSSMKNKDLQCHMDEVMATIGVAVEEFPGFESGTIDDVHMMMETALLNFLMAILNVFLQKANDKWDTQKAREKRAKEFIESFSDEIKCLYIRLLSDIQLPETPVEFINKVISVLTVSGRYSVLYSELASEPEIFDLLLTSQIVRGSSDDDEDSESIRILFNSLFTLAYAQSEPTTVEEMITSLFDALETENYRTVFAKITGAFTPENCCFGFSFGAMQEVIFPRCQEILESNNVDLVEPLLDLLVKMSECSSFAELPPMSPAVIDFCEAVCQLLECVARLLHDVPKDDILLLKAPYMILCILNTLFECQSVNTGMLELYEKCSFVQPYMFALESFISIPFEGLEDMSWIAVEIARFIQTQFSGDPDVFMNLEDFMAVHIVQLMIFLIQSAKPELMRHGIDALGCIVIGSRNTCIDNVCGKIGTALEEALRVTMNMVFVEKHRETHIFLLLLLSHVLPEARDRLFAAIAENFKSPAQQSIIQRQILEITACSEVLVLDEFASVKVTKGAGLREHPLMEVNKRMSGEQLASAKALASAITKLGGKTDISV